MFGVRHGFRKTLTTAPDRVSDSGRNRTALAVRLTSSYLTSSDQFYLTSSHRNNGKAHGNNAKAHANKTAQRGKVHEESALYEMFLMFYIIVLRLSL